MPVLTNSKHEHFAQAIAKGLNATQAYISAGYSKAGAGQSAQRLLKNAQICSRVKELAEAISAGTIQLEISNRNARVRALQDRWKRLSNGVDVLLTERGADLAGEIAGGSTGLLVRDYKGKDATQPIYRVDSGLVSLVQELRAHEKQAAQELGQWSEEKPEEPTARRFTGTMEELLALYAMTAREEAPA